MELDEENNLLVLLVASFTFHLDACLGSPNTSFARARTYSPMLQAKEKVSHHWTRWVRVLRLEEKLVEGTFGTILVVTVCRVEVDHERVCVWRYLGVRWPGFQVVQLPTVQGMVFPDPRRANANSDLVGNVRFSLQALCEVLRRISYHVDTFNATKQAKHAKRRALQLLHLVRPVLRAIVRWHRRVYMPPVRFASVPTRRTAEALTGAGR